MKHNAPQSPEFKRLCRPGPILTCMADVEPRAISWLWRDRIPMGRITLLVGRPGEGKSLLTIDAAARVTTGAPWPDGSFCPHGSVILISDEDDPNDTIRPRLDAHRADVRRVHLLTAVRGRDGEGHRERMITLSDVDAIEAALVELRDCKLIVVDPIGSFLGGRTDAHRDNEVRSVLGPIAKLAQQYGPAVLVVSHTRKSEGRYADDLALGSRAFTGIARAVWHLMSDPNDKARRLLLAGKSNNAAENGGLAFCIAKEPPRITWESDAVEMCADDLLAVDRAANPGPEAEALEAASSWLRSALADGPRPAKELLDEWKNGQSGSKRTLDRAKRSLAVEAYRLDVPGPWWWRMPKKDGGRAEHKQPGNLGNVVRNPGNLPFIEADECKGAKSSAPNLTSKQGAYEDASDGTKQSLSVFSEGDSKNSTSSNGRPGPRSEEIADVFAHYRRYHPKARLGDKERRLIAARLKEGFSVAECCRAIDGIHRSPFHSGDNEAGRKYQSLDLIFRDASKTTQFMEMTERPEPELSAKNRASLRAAERFLHNSKGTM